MHNSTFQAGPHARNRPEEVLAAAGGLPPVLLSGIFRVSAVPREGQGAAPGPARR